jgi:hypothetical protein
VTSWNAINDELRAARGVSIGGVKREPEQPPAAGRLGAGRAGVMPSTRRRTASGQVNEVIRAAAEERGHRNRAYELPVSALFGRRR